MRESSPAQDVPVMFGATGRAGRAQGSTLRANRSTLTALTGCRLCAQESIFCVAAAFGSYIY